MTEENLNLTENKSYENDRKRNRHEYRTAFRMDSLSKDIGSMEDECSEHCCILMNGSAAFQEDDTFYYLIINGNVRGHSSRIDALLEILTDYHLSIELYGEILKKEILSQKYMSSHDGIISFDYDVIDMETGKEFDMCIIDERVLKYCQNDSEILSAVCKFNKQEK